MEPWNFTWNHCRKLFACPCGKRTFSCPLRNVSCNYCYPCKKEHSDYDVVHLHSSSKNFFVLKEAKKFGIKTRIAHAHNVGFQTTNKIKIIVGNILKSQLIKNATNYFACSKLAGIWLFGEKIVNSDKFRVIHNAIEYDKFVYNENIRKRVRNELDIDENTLVIGNVGRFTNQKNHELMIDIFNEIHKKNNNSKLMLIGIGENEEKTKNKVKSLGVENDVLFLGFKENVNEYLSSMDAFLMPSLYEGLPVVAVEAQASGLPCFMSKDVITDEVKINPNVEFISLNSSAKEWADYILSSDLKRIETKENFEKAGYIMAQEIKTLEKFYLNEI